MIRAERGRAAGAIACALALATGCGSQTSTATPPAATPAVPAPAPADPMAPARAQLEQALTALAPENGADRARSLAKAITDSVASGDGCLTSFAASAAPAAVRAACPADAGNDASVTQLVLDHAGKLIAKAYTGADTSAIEKLLAALPIRMPLPAKGSIYTLPTLTGVATASDFGRTYVILGADSALHAGRVPMATVHPGGVTVSVDRGAPFPGEAIDRFSFANHEAFDAKTVAPAIARLRGKSPDAQPADGATDQKGKAGALAAAPVLMFLDQRYRALDAIWLTEVLLWSELAVPGPNGTAAALPVHLRVAPPGDGGVQPVVAIDSYGVYVGLAHPTKVTRLERVRDGSAPPAGLTDALTAARAKAPAGAEVLLKVDGPPTVVELAQLLAAVHAAGVDAVAVQSGALEGAPHPVPKARILAVKVKGRLAPAAVEKALNRARDNLATCFAEQEAAKPGTYSVSFLVAPTGRSAGAHAKGTNQELANCVVETTDKLRFPRPRGAATVSYRVEFSVAIE